MKFSHTALAYISGIIWLVVGCFLLQLGLSLLSIAIDTAGPDKSLPMLHFLRTYVGGYQEGAIALIMLALFIGYLKGKHVLGKSAQKGVEHISTFPNPTSLSNMYNAKYYILLGAMIALGMSIKFLGLPNDVRGTIDVAIGAALINGAMCYFRMGRQLQKPQPSSEV